MDVINVVNLTKRIHKYELTMDGSMGAYGRDGKLIYKIPSDSTKNAIKFSNETSRPESWVK